MRVLRRRSRLLLVGVLGVLVFWWAVTRLTGNAERPVAWEDLAGAVGPVEFPVLEQHRFRNQHDFSRFFRHAETGRPFRIPTVDFTRYEVAMFTVGPRSSTGYTLAVRRVYERGGKIVIVVDEKTPRLGSPGRAALTFPFVLVRLPRRLEPVVVDWLQHP